MAGLPDWLDPNATPQQIFAAADEDGDGVLSQEELANLRKRVPDLSNKIDLAKLDADGDGIVSKDELGKALNVWDSSAGQQGSRGASDERGPIVPARPPSPASSTSSNTKADREELRNRLRAASQLDIRRLNYRLARSTPEPGAKVAPTTPAQGTNVKPRLQEVAEESNHTPQVAKPLRSGIAVRDAGAGRLDKLNLPGDSQGIQPADAPPPLTVSKRTSFVAELHPALGGPVDWSVLPPTTADERHEGKPGLPKASILVPFLPTAASSSRPVPSFTVPTPVHEPTAASSSRPVPSLTVLTPVHEPTAASSSSLVPSLTVPTPVNEPTAASSSRPVPSFTVPTPVHGDREVTVRVPELGVLELGSLRHWAPGRAGLPESLEVLGLRLVIVWQPEKPSSWRLEVESSVPAAFEFWDKYKGIRRGDVLLRVDGQEIEGLDGKRLEALMRSPRPPQQFVFRRVVINHLRWLREGPLCSPARWEEETEHTPEKEPPKALTGLQHWARELQAEEDRRLFFQQEAKLAEELAAKLTVSQDRERQYIRAEAEVFAAKNLRGEKEERIEAIVEQIAWNTEEMTLRRLAFEHEAQLAEMKAEAATWQQQKEASLKEYLEHAQQELQAIESEEAEYAQIAKLAEAKAAARRKAFEATRSRQQKAKEAAEQLKQRSQALELQFEAAEAESFSSLGEERALEEALATEEATFLARSRENSRLQERLRAFRSRAANTLQEINEEEQDARALRERLRSRQQSQEQISKDIQRQFQAEEHQVEVIAQKIVIEETACVHRLELVRSQEESQQKQLLDQEAKEKDWLSQERALEIGTQKRQLELDEQERLVEERVRRLNEMEDRVKNLELQQKALTDKENQFRLQEVDRRDDVAKRSRELQLQQVQDRLQDIRLQQETFHDQLQAKLERQQRQAELHGQRVRELEEQTRLTFKAAAISGKDDPLQLKLAVRRAEEINQDLINDREELQKQRSLLMQHEQNVGDREQQLAKLQQDLLDELEDELAKPRVRSIDGEETPEAKTARLQLEAVREDMLKQIEAEKQLRQQYSGQRVKRQEVQIQTLLDTLDSLQVQAVLSDDGRARLKRQASEKQKEQVEWLQELEAAKAQLQQYEEASENWQEELKALRDKEVLAEATLQEAERQAREEAAKHLAEGKLVAGANLEVIFTDPGPVGLVFFADANAPARVRKVKKERRDYWTERGLKPGASILAVGDTPAANLSAAEVLPLLNTRPLRLQFQVEDEAAEDVNAVDERGQTALHRAAEAGDEDRVLEILQMPSFTSINVKDSLGKTALHWAAVAGLESACAAILATEAFVEDDAEDYAGLTAYEAAEAAGQTEVIKIFDHNRTVIEHAGY